MSTQRRINFTPNLVVGLGIMLLGLVLMLDQLGLADARELLRLWPVLLILFGASIVREALHGDADSSTAGRRERPIVTPPLVILLVIAFLFISHAQRRSETASTTTTAETVDLFAVMGRDHRTSSAKSFRGGEMTSIMGRTHLDLRQSVMSPGEEAVVDVFALMGRVVLQVPRDWVVDVQAMPIMGGVKDERTRVARRSDQDGQPVPDALEQVEAERPIQTAPPPRVVLRGFVMMGGLTIRS